MTTMKYDPAPKGQKQSIVSEAQRGAMFAEIDRRKKSEKQIIDKMVDKIESEETTMKIQYHRSDGKYRDATPEQADDMITGILKRESWYAERVGRKPMTTRAQVITQLQSGKSLQYGSDWYEKIRMARPPASKAELDAYHKREQAEEKRLHELDEDIY